jgi:hypothetical protein
VEFSKGSRVKSHSASSGLNTRRKKKLSKKRDMPSSVIDSFALIAYFPSGQQHQQFLTIQAAEITESRTNNWMQRHVASVCFVSHYNGAKVTDNLHLSQKQKSRIAVWPILSSDDQSRRYRTDLNLLHTNKFPKSERCKLE